LPGRYDCRRSRILRDTTEACGTSKVRDSFPARGKELQHRGIRKKEACDRVRLYVEDWVCLVTVLVVLVFGGVTEKAGRATKTFLVESHVVETAFWRNLRSIYYGGGGRARRSPLLWWGAVPQRKYPPLIQMHTNWDGSVLCRRVVVGQSVRGWNVSGWV
jgi:hypothetical protein